MDTTRWNDLTPAQRQAIIAVGVATSVWQLAMLVDLWRRPAARIRGSKRLWLLASFVRPVGQIAYYGWGRRSAAETDGQTEQADAGPDRPSEAEPPAQQGAAFAPVGRQRERPSH